MLAVKADKRGKKVHHSVAPISYNSTPPKTQWTDLYWWNSVALFSEEAKVYGEHLFYYMRILEWGLRPSSFLSVLYYSRTIVLFYMLMNDTKSIMWFEIPKDIFFFIHKYRKNNMTWNSQVLALAFEGLCFPVAQIHRIELGTSSSLSAEDSSETGDLKWWFGGRWFLMGCVMWSFFFQFSLMLLFGFEWSLLVKIIYGGEWPCI